MTSPKRVWLKPYSVNGTGIRLLDYRPVSPGLFEVSRWFTFFFLPIAPIGSWVIRPGNSETVGLGSNFHFEIVNVRPLQLLRVLRTYAMAILALAPVGLMLWWLGDRRANTIELALLLATFGWMLAWLIVGEFRRARIFKGEPAQPLPTGGRPATSGAAGR
jgi:hypothetical protein